MQYDGLGGFTVTVGKGFTVTVTVAVPVHPAAEVPVTVYVVVTVGDAVGLAQVVQLNPVDGAQLYVDAPLAVSEVLLPEQMEGAFGLTVMVGKGFTVTVTVAVPVQPDDVVPVTVYVVVTVGFAVTVAPVVELRFVAGDQTYVLAPLAVNDVLFPIQMLGADGLTVMVALPFTVTQTTLDVTLPQLLVTTAWKQIFELTGPKT